MMLFCVFELWQVTVKYLFLLFCVYVGDSFEYSVYYFGLVSISFCYVFDGVEFIVLVLCVHWYVYESVNHRVECSVFVLFVMVRAVVYEVYSGGEFSVFSDDLHIFQMYFRKNESHPECNVSLLIIANWYE